MDKVELWPNLNPKKVQVMEIKPGKINKQRKIKSYIINLICIILFSYLMLIFNMIFIHIWNKIIRR